MYRGTVSVDSGPILLNSTELRALRWAAEGLVRVARGDIPPSLRAAVRRLPAAIAATETAERMSVPGPMFRADPGNYYQDETPIDATEAAQLLGINPRSVRRRAVELGGRKVAGRWMFHPATIAEHAEGAERGRRSHRD